MTTQSAPTNGDGSARTRRLREAARLLIAGVIGGALTLVGTTGIGALRTNVSATAAPDQATQLRDEMLLAWHPGVINGPSGASVIWHYADARR